VSSSSSGRDPLAPCGPLQALVAESFGLLELQQSGRHRSLLEKLRGRVVCLRSGGEVFVMDFTTADLRFRGGVSGADSAADVDVAFDRVLINDLVSGALDLQQALLSDRLRVVGSFSEVVRLYDALETYLHAAVRSLSFPELWRRHRHEFAGEEKGV